MLEEDSPETRSDEEIETHRLPSPSLDGFGFVKSSRRLPSGQSLREATVKVLGRGPLHKILEKRWSEPGSVGKLGKRLKENRALVKTICVTHQVITIANHNQRPDSQIGKITNFFDVSVGQPSIFELGSLPLFLGRVFINANFKSVAISAG